jgi:pimeloyl-ACP methyl ester carboxylesterase
VSAECQPIRRSKNGVSIFTGAKSALRKSARCEACRCAWPGSPPPLSAVLPAAISIGSSSRAELLDRVRKADKPTVVIYRNETQPRLRAEIEALGDLPNVRVERLPKGKLSIHEEFPDFVAPAIKIVSASA